MAGTYTEIKAISVPPIAEAGTTVVIEVEVRNLHDGDNYIYVDGEVDGTYLAFGGYYYAVPAFGVIKFTDSFVMPNRRVIVEVVSWYYGGGGWNYDDESSKSIELPIVLPGEEEILPPAPPGEEPQKGIGWEIPLAVGGGLLLVALMIRK